MLQITLNKMDYSHGSYLRPKAPDLLTKLTKGCVDQPICGCERDNTRVKKGICSISDNMTQEKHRRGNQVAISHSR